MSLVPNRCSYSGKAAATRPSARAPADCLLFAKRERGRQPVSEAQLLWS
jgi:hypothetical protein